MALPTTPEIVVLPLFLIFHIGIPCLVYKFFLKGPKWFYVLIVFFGPLSFILYALIRGFGGFKDEIN